MFIKVSFVLLLFLHLRAFLGGLYAHEGEMDSHVARMLRQEIEQEIVLLKNHQTILPIQSLGGKRIGLLNTGGDKRGKVFFEMLNNYALVEQYFSYPRAKEIREGYQKEWAAFDLLIVAIYEITTVTEFEQLENWYKNLAEPPSLVFTFFTKDSFGTPISSDLAKAVLLANGSSADHESLAAQAIFGGIGINRKLDKEWWDFAKGVGVNMKPIGRFKFTSPDEVGMDAEFVKTKVDSICNNAIALGAFPGCQVLVAKDRKVVFHETYGYHTYRKNKEVRKDDLYDFASVTKITSALTALMKFHGEGVFDVDKQMGDYFPFLKGSDKEDLIIRDVLAHQARLKPWIPYWMSTVKENGKFRGTTFKTDSSKRFPTKVTDRLFLHQKYQKKIYRAIKKSSLEDQKEYRYSGLAFYLFPELVERLSGQMYEDYLKKTFYEPLGAATVTYNPLRFFPKERIIPTEKDTFFRKEQIHGRVHDEGAAMMGGVSANAGLFGKAIDLAKIMQMYMDYGTYGGQRYIAVESMKEFTRYQFRQEGNRRGLGFDKPLLENKTNGSVSPLASDLSFGHSGYTGMFTWADPANGLLFVFCSNRVHPTRDNRKIYEYNVRPALHHVFYQALER